jgi:chemotaxis protein CheX
MKMIAQDYLSEALIAGSREVFEKMIFMQIEKISDEDFKAPQENDVLLSSISFRNGMEGCLGICCERDCARAIAINMLAMSPDTQISDNEIKDAMGEVANMVMGTVKTAIQSDMKNLQVSIPVVVTGRNLQNSLGEGTYKLSVCVTTSENHIIELTLLYRESRDKN